MIDSTNKATKRSRLEFEASKAPPRKRGKDKKVRRTSEEVPSGNTQYNVVLGISHITFAIRNVTVRKNGSALSVKADVKLFHSSSCATTKGSNNNNA